MKKIIACILCLFFLNGIISPGIKAFGTPVSITQNGLESDHPQSNTIIKDENQNLLLNLTYSETDNSLLGALITADPQLDAYYISNIDYNFLNDKYSFTYTNFEITEYKGHEEESGSIPLTRTSTDNLDPGIYRTIFSFYDDTKTLVGTEDVYINIYDEFSPRVTTTVNEITVESDDILSESELIQKFGLKVVDNRFGELSTSNIIDSDVYNSELKSLPPGEYDIVIPSAKWVDQFYAQYPNENENSIEQKIVKIIVIENNSDQLTDNSSDDILSGIIIENQMIKYRSHIQNIGWQNYVEQGQTSGTTDLNLRMEALEVSITDNPNLGVSYSTFIQNQGWNERTSDGIPNGTVGLSQAIEAIQVELTGIESDYFDIYYRTYVNELGWMDWAKNGEYAGTEGYNYQIEAVEIQVVPINEIFPYPTGVAFKKYQDSNEIIYRMSDVETGWSGLLTTSNSTSPDVSKGIEALSFLVKSNFDLGIKYSARIENIGWQGYAENGGIAGTVGKNQHLEALKIELTGSDKSQFDIYYRINTLETGWMDWAKNGAPSGTESYGYAAINIEIKIALKDTLELQTNTPFLSKELTHLIRYKSHVQNVGWQDYFLDGDTSGTENENKRLEALILNLNESLPSGSIHYSTHIQDIGWTSEISDGGIAGTIGMAKRVEAVKIRLSGTISESYDVFYRVKIKGYDWLGWGKNGEASGSEGYSMQLEAIEICLKPKNNHELTSNLKPFIDKLGTPVIFHGSSTEGSDFLSYKQQSVISGSVGNSQGLTGMGLKIFGNREYTMDYSVYKSNYGWISSNGSQELALSDNNSIEAIKVEISGELANEYDVVYRVHIQNYGWLDWTKNGHGTGSMDMGLRLEAYEIMLIPKTQSNINITESSMKTKYELNDYTAQSHIQFLGWRTESPIDSYTGTVGKGLRLEALDINVAPHLPSGTISLEAYVQGLGWVGENQSSFVGTVGEGRRIEEFKLRLTGLAAEEYDVYYRVHVSNLGWLGWTKNGEKAGSALFQNQVEAIDIDLVKKSDSPPVSGIDSFLINVPSNMKTLYMERNDCYNLDRKIVPKGIVLHSTATPGVMAWEWYSRWNKSYDAGETNRQVAVHSFVDGNEIWQYLPWNHRGWHAGGSANNTHIGIEMCEPAGFTYSGNRMIGYDVVKNTAYFNSAWRNAVNLSVMLSRMYDFNETDIISHAEGYKIGVASNHSDVSHWFPLHGKNMDMFRKEVRDYLNL